MQDDGGEEGDSRKVKKRKQSQDDSSKADSCNGLETYGGEAESNDSIGDALKVKKRKQTKNDKGLN